MYSDLIYVETAEMYDFTKNGKPLENNTTVYLTVAAWLDDGDDEVDEKVVIPITIDNEKPQIVGEPELTADGIKVTEMDFGEYEDDYGDSYPIVPIDFGYDAASKTLYLTATAMEVSEYGCYCASAFLYEVDMSNGSAEQLFDSMEYALANVEVVNGKAVLTVEEGKIVATFTSDDGLSPFVFSTSNKAVAQIGGAYYSTLQEAVDTAKNGDTIIVSDPEAKSVVGRSLSVTLEGSEPAIDTSKMLSPVGRYSMNVEDGEDGSCTYTSIAATYPRPHPPTP